MSGLKYLTLSHDELQGPDVTPPAPEGRATTPKTPQCRHTPGRRVVLPCNHNNHNFISCVESERESKFMERG
ncbi:hypothetical protein E2C01_073443 [Portunus trituberculatus]|uniref:Uncharacterized protein n=1 Tax=Portunus trituberculatus TaxID=210409 RepID=A0A5B7I9R5_PORTR|nr:hypothetical protein [Portunus trituberculatus]